MIDKTIIIPIIHDLFLGRMLYTLFAYTDNFQVIVIDNTGDTKAQAQFGNNVHLWIKPHRNLGFAQSMNLGARLATTKYVIYANDDVELINSRWWQGILDAFAQDPRIVAVNPMSIKDASWGFGYTAENHDAWQPKEGFYAIDNKTGIVPIIDGIPFIYKEKYTEAEYDLLLNKHPNWGKDTLLDGIATWFTVVRRDDVLGRYARLGLFDERFFPGGGEDMDLNGRAYSCAWPIDREECDPDYHYRAVGTTKSYVFHHWSKSQNISAKDPGNTLFAGRDRWNYVDRLWIGGFDTWGHYEKEGKRVPYRRVPEVFTHEL